MRKVVVSLLGAIMLAVGIFVTAAAADPPSQPCPGDLVSSAARIFDGRRNAADTFFGNDPKSVQEAQTFMKDFCGLPGGNP
jgi:hypothetical protein